MEKQYLTVSALTRYIKVKMERDPHLQTIWLKGEISNFKFHSRGHMYFTLKDEQAKISAVMFAGANRLLTFRPEDGMTVLVRGHVSLYEAGGSYQLYIQEMQVDGVGNLYVAYEQLKARLEQEGLFSRVYKQSLPLYPRTVGVITSPTGAAVRDVLTTISRRYPIAHVVVFPALVQGGAAAPSIVRAIEQANALGNVDVLIVGRGGGSIEELWAFNEESVARAIFASRIPIVSAVGHETDFTIADFVADLRAPTPTAAAEQVVPNMSDVQDKLAQYTSRLHRVVREHVQYKKERLATLQQSYAFRNPQQLYVQKEEKLDRYMDRFLQVMQRVVERNTHRVEQVTLQLQQHHPAQRVSRAKENVLATKKQLEKEMQTVLREKMHAFVRTAEKLEALSPLQIMMRGYSVAYNKERKIVKSVNEIEAGELLTVQLHDGVVMCSVCEVEERGIDERE